MGTLVGIIICLMRLCNICGYSHHLLLNKCVLTYETNLKTIISEPHQPPVEWIPCTDFNAEALTHRAVVAGYEGHDGSPLWVIRAHHEGDIIPGKLAIKHKSAYVPWGGQEVRVHNFEVSRFIYLWVE